MFNINGIDHQLTKLENVIGNQYDTTRNDEALQVIYSRLVSIANRMIDTDSLDEADPEALSPMGRVALAMARIWVETRDETEVLKAFDEGIEPLVKEKGDL